MSNVTLKMFTLLCVGLDAWLKVQTKLVHKLSEYF